jgi:hypothetical protein
MDLKIGFFQIKMDPESAHFTASTEPREFFQYKRMTMDLNKSPIMFMKDTEKSMAGLS